MKSLLKIVAKFPLKDIQFKDKVAKGETVVGVLPDELKRFWGFVMKIKKEGAPKFEDHHAEAKRLEMEFRARHETAEENHDHSQCLAQIEAIEAEMQKAKKINDEFTKIFEIFWLLVKLEFGLDNVNLAIREGGQVVTWESPKKKGGDFSDIGALLDMITRSSGGIPVFRVYTGAQKKSGIGDFLESIFGGR